MNNSAHHSICLGAKNLDDYKTAIEAVEMKPLPQETALRIEEISSALEA